MKNLDFQHLISETEQEKEREHTERFIENFRKEISKTVYPLFLTEQEREHYLNGK